MELNEWKNMVKSLKMTFPLDKRPDSVLIDEYFISLKPYPFIDIRASMNYLSAHKMQDSNGKEIIHIWSIKEIINAIPVKQKTNYVTATWKSPADGRIVGRNDLTLERVLAMQKKHPFSDVKIHWDCLPSHLKQLDPPASPDYAEKWIKKILKQIEEGTGPLFDEIDEESLPF